MGIATLVDMGFTAKSAAKVWFLPGTQFQVIAPRVLQQWQSLRCQLVTIAISAALYA